MAKFLTLNTHSWLEANSLKKLFDLAETIYSENYDVICLQEINQDIRGLLTKEVDGYEKLPGSPALHRDNYALQLVNYLRSQGRYYYWSWAYNHIGYEKYNEGVVILSTAHLIYKTATKWLRKSKATIRLLKTLTAGRAINNPSKLTMFSQVKVLIFYHQPSHLTAVRHQSLVTISVLPLSLTTNNTTS